MERKLRTYRLDVLREFVKGLPEDGGTVTAYMMNDRECTEGTVWKDGAFTLVAEIPGTICTAPAMRQDGTIRVAGLYGSDWDTPMYEWRRDGRGPIVHSGDGEPIDWKPRRNPHLDESPSARAAYMLRTMMQMERDRRR